MLKINKNVVIKAAGLACNIAGLILSNLTQKDEIKKNFSNALGVEMEGAAFAQVARHFNIPLVAIRAISDNGDANADNDFDKFVNEDGAKAASIIASYLEETVLD